MAQPMLLMLFPKILKLQHILVKVQYASQPQIPSSKILLCTVPTIYVTQDYIPSAGSILSAISGFTSTFNYSDKEISNY